MKIVIGNDKYFYCWYFKTIKQYTDCLFSEQSTKRKPLLMKKQPSKMSGAFLVVFFDIKGVDLFQWGDFVFFSGESFRPYSGLFTPEK